MLKTIYLNIRREFTSDHGRLVTIDGRTIRRARRAKGWTLKDLAKKTGVSYVQVSRIERGRRGTSLEVLTRIARALGLKQENV